MPEIRLKFWGFVGPTLGLLALASCGPTAIPLVTSPPVVTSTTSNPACDGSGVSSSTDALSVGSSGGCVSAITAAIEADAETIRNTSMYRQQVESHVVNSNLITSHSLLAGRFEYAHALNLTGAEQTVAVYDDGFRASHNEFSGKSVSYGFGETASTITVDSHGTAVAGLIGGTADVGRTVGAAPNVALHLMSWNDGNDEDAVREAEAIGAIAMNNSWGYTCSSAFDECGINDYAASFIGSRFLSALGDYAGDEGIVVFAASNEEAQTQATLMAALPKHVPALEEGWLAVINLARDYDTSATDRFDDTKVGRMSSGCLEAARWCIAADGTSYIASSSRDSTYTDGTGTSYAAPRVSAAIALLAEAFPNLSAKELRNRLLITADNDFFASDTANITTMSFAGGLTHDYHWVYGHGFVDMRQALLPIGATYTPTSRGRVTLDAPTIIASSAIGDGLKTSLAGVALRAVDQMGAEFSTDATALSARRTTDQRHARALSVFDPSQAGRSLTDLSEDYLGVGDITAQSMVVPLSLNENWQVAIALPQNEFDQTGVSIYHSGQQANTNWKLGLTATHDPNSLLGMTLAEGGSLTSTHLGLDAEYETTLGSGYSFAVNGNWGAANAASSGMITGFDDVKYNSVGVQLSQTGFITKNGVLSLFALQPTAMTSGAASAVLDVYDSSGKAALRDVDFALSPSARELEVGFDYSYAPLGGTEWLARVSQRLNAGNRAGEEETHILLGLRRQF